MEKKYRALRTIATIFRILGWVILVLGILSACGASAAMLLGGQTMMGMGGYGGAGDAGFLYSLIFAIVAFVGTIVTLGLYALILIALAEGIQVFLDIEANTREMARRLAQRGVTAPPSVPAE
jgi:magnesium-transporting ATPase (P-type)